MRVVALIDLELDGEARLLFVCAWGWVVRTIERARRIAARRAGLTADDLVWHEHIAPRVQLEDDRTPRATRTRWVIH